MELSYSVSDSSLLSAHPNRSLDIRSSHARSRSALWTVCFFGVLGFIGSSISSTSEKKTSENDGALLLKTESRYLSSLREHGLNTHMVIHIETKVLH